MSTPTLPTGHDGIADQDDAVTSTWPSLTTQREEPYLGLATALRHEHGPAALEEEEALVLFHAQLAIMSGYSFNTRALEPWDTYAGLLDDYVNDVQREDLRVLWDFAHREVKQRAADLRDDPLDPHTYTATYTAAVPTAIDELRADTTVEFIELLRTLITRSGVSANQIAQRAPDAGPGKLNASQLYSVLTRSTLPRSAEQVRSFAAACGLDEDQTQQLLWTWATLRVIRRHPKTTGPATRSDVDHLAADPRARARGGVTARHRTPHRPQHRSIEEGAGGSRATVEGWLDRAERRHRSKTGWAPPEPTEDGASQEAVAVTRRLAHTLNPDLPT